MLRKTPGVIYLPETIGAVTVSDNCWCLSGCLSVSIGKVSDSFW